MEGRLPAIARNRESSALTSYSTGVGSPRSHGAACALADPQAGYFVVVFRMPRKPRVAKPLYTNILDYPSTMSIYERESLAAEAKLKAEREKRKPEILPPKSQSRHNGHKVVISPHQAC
jgi:hypothetical protein